MTQLYFSFEASTKVSSAEATPREPFKVPMTWAWKQKLRHAAGYLPSDTPFQVDASARAIVVLYLAQCPGEPTLEDLDQFLTDYIKKGIRRVHQEQAESAALMENWLCRWPGARRCNH